MPLTISAPNNKFEPYLRMANAIIDLTLKNGGCLPQDLLPLGFSKLETIDTWPMAHAMARIELNLIEDKALPKSNGGTCFA